MRLDTRLPEKVSPVSADIERLIQVLLNLLSNALKFLRGGSEDASTWRCPRPAASCASTCATAVGRARTVRRTDGVTEEVA